jgi:DNA-binding NarL/FixJ family response regulator
MRIVIAEDSVLLRDGLRRLFTDEGHDVTAAVGDAGALLAVVRKDRPDVAVVDIRMPPTHTDEGLRAAVQIRAEYPEVGVLVLSQYVEQRYALELLGGDTRGVGYLLKDRVADVADFVAAVRRVDNGGTALDPDVVAQMFGQAKRQDTLGTLTPREKEVLAAMAEGLSNAAIAEHLVVSEGAVEKHVTNLFAKLGLMPSDAHHRRVLAVLTYLRS